MRERIMMQRLSRGALAASLAVVLAACPGKAGSGNLGSETRAVSAFTVLEVGGGWELDITAGGKETSVELTGDDNLLPLVQTTMAGERLKVEPKEQLRPALPLRLVITVPVLERIKCSGAASGQVRGLTGDQFRLETSGSSKLTLSGEVKRLELDTSGSGTVHALDLKAQEVEVEISGAGDAKVHASRALTVDISGAGSVRYRGRPAEVNRQVSGSGSVEPLDDPK